MRWLISVPVWGEKFVDVFRMAGLPALNKAVAVLAGDDVRIILHTDAGDWQTAVPVEVRPPAPAGSWDGTMSAAHRDCLDMAQPGDAVVLMTADMILSENALSACRVRFAEFGQKLVCCHCTRAITERWRDAPPADLSSRSLARWGWDNRHDLVRAVTWPDGHSADLSRMYFERDGNVVAREWLPHPLALVKDGRGLPFGPTIDCDLTRNFNLDEIHLSESSDEMAIIDLSPADKFVMTREEFEARFSDGCSMGEILSRQHLAHDVYRHFLTFRLGLVGEKVDCGDEEAVRQVVADHTRAAA